MSITTELTRLQSAKNALKTAINAKGGTLTDELLGAYAQAVANLSGDTLVKVKRFTAASAEIPQQKGYIVSGVYSAYNGTYAVTEETQNSSNTGRIYTNGTCYLCAVDPETFVLADDDASSVIWKLDTELRSGDDPEDAAIMYCTQGNYTNPADVPSWRNSTETLSDVSVAETITQQYVAAAALDLAVEKVTGISESSGLRTFQCSSTEMPLTGYDKTPEVGKIYLKNGNTLSGYPGMKSTYGINGLLFSPDFTLGNGTANVEVECPEGSYTPLSNITLTTDSGHHALRLQSAAVRLSVQQADLTRDFTVSLWVKLTGTGRTSILSSSSQKCLELDTYGGTFNMWAGNGSSWSILDGQYTSAEDVKGGKGTAAVSTGTWQHLVMTRSGAEWNLYVNGAVSLHRTRYYAAGSSGNIMLNYGTYQNTDISYSGVRVWKRGLTASEITALYEEEV